MGREKICDGSLGNDRGEVRAMLESNEIILRGDITAKLPLQTLRSMRAHVDKFEALTDRGKLSLALGATEAAAWLTRIHNPRSLIQKLGIKQHTPVHVIDEHPEFRGVISDSGAKLVALQWATIVFVVIETEAQLSALCRLVHTLPGASQLWVLRRKGKQVTVKESVIMAALKEQGLAPSKTTAWSSDYAADRYGRSRRAVKQSSDVTQP